MEAATTTTPSSARGRAFVRMFEIVNAAQWTSSANGSIDDLRPLLLMMDIGSCASAEKHTRVNCVTASMGDVVIEHYPEIGDLLELQAVPVDVGNTSLNIAVLVLAHGASSNEEHNNQGGLLLGQQQQQQQQQQQNLARTKRVCEAFFTYVTTRGPNGEKRFVPPLEESDGGSSIRAPKNSMVDCARGGVDAWERTLARFRKQLIRSEQALMHQHPRGYTIPRSQAVLECSEVILPSHQNHMEHLFGGIVMGWMCKSVLAACVTATRLPLTSFRIRSIHRVDFPKGADVSDHVFLRPRINAVFDGGQSAEVEVVVGKRCVTGCDNNNEEVTVNTGYFYVSGHQREHHRAPFARLLQQRRGRRFSAALNTSSYMAMARKRRTALYARRHLLAGLGEPITWDPSLEVQAPLMTILWVLRLCNEYEKSSSIGKYGEQDDGGDGDGSSCWNTIVLGGSEEGRGEEPALSGRHSPIQCEWTYGNALGHDNTVVFRSQTILSRKKKTGNGSGYFLQDVYRTLRGLRCQWDPFCTSVTVLDQKDEDDQDSIFWDVAEYEMKASTASMKLCLLRAAAYIDEDGSNFNARSSTMFDNTTTAPSIGIMASRSVRHKESSAESRVLPSGFLLKTPEGEDGGGGIRATEDEERLEITYITEHDFDALRKSGAFGTNHLSDDYLVCFLASMMRGVLTNLASIAAS